MLWCKYFVFFNDMATTEIYTLSLHDALPIWWATPTGTSTGSTTSSGAGGASGTPTTATGCSSPRRWSRSEEHTSELQSRLHLVCRLLLEKKKRNYKHII